MFKRFFVLSAFVVTAACVPPASVPEPAPQPQAPVTPAPAPTVQQPQGKWTDWPITPGDWAYRQDNRGSIALFGQPGRDALVTLRCDKTRGRIYLTRRSNLRSANIAIRSSARLKNAAASTSGGQPAYLAVELSPSDPILAAIAYSRGRFAIETGGELSLAIPVWSEIGRVIDDCL